MCKEASRPGARSTADVRNSAILIEMKIPAIVTLAILSLVGCGSSSKSSDDSIPTSLTGNWQIQTGSGSGTAPALGAVLLGDLASNGSKVSGTFRYSNLSAPTKCTLNQVVMVSSSMDATRNLTLTSAALPDGSVIKAQLVIPAVLTDFAAGTIEVTGGTTCGLASGTAIGVELASLTGTFAGPLTPGMLSGTVPGTTGTGSLVLTEGATPEADGQFPVTGTLNYTIGTCTESVALIGQHSGVLLTLNGVPANPTVFSQAVVGTAPPDGSKVTAEVAFLKAACPSGDITVLDYVGSLAKR